MSYSNEVKFSDLVGKTLIQIKNDHDEIIFRTDNNEVYKMHHYQDCCESVTVEDITGDLEDLLNSPIIQAEESSNTENPKDEYEDSFTWTFYRLATKNGFVTIRWYGSSNGYYSESVDFEKVEE